MRKKISFFDFFVLGLISVFTYFYVDIHFASDFGYIFSFNDILLFSLILFSIRYIFYKSDKGQYILLFSLIVGLINVIKFSYTVNDVTYSTSSSAQFGSFSFNPFAFFLLLFFALVNRKEIMKLIRTILNGSEEEQLVKHNKMIDFYYDKFNTCADSELVAILANYKKYPEEAQMALKKIETEKLTVE